MRNNIENPYKVNANHHHDVAMSADLVEEVFNGTVKWICYLFAAGAVTPMRTTEFNTLNDAEQWAKDKGSEIWTYFPLDDERVRHCIKCDNGFVVLDTLPDQVYCSEKCWQLDKHDHIKRDNEGNIIAGRMRDKARKEYRSGQTIDFQHCLKKDTLESIMKDASDLSDIEHVGSVKLLTTEIVFVDDSGNQYEYDAVCISEGKLKIRIKPIYNIRIK